VERFNKSYIVAQQAFKEGSIGNLVSIRTQRMSARHAVKRLAKRDDVITFLSVHDIDLMHWFAGSIKKISVEADSFTFPEYPENNDAVFILARFESGALGLVQVTWGVIDKVPFKASAKLELIGDKGIIKVDTVDHSVTIHSENGFNNLIGWDRADAFNGQLTHFIDCIEKNEAPRVGLKEGLDSLKIALAALEGTKSGQPVEIK
jgi:predicted dehydrogenase